VTVLHALPSSPVGMPSCHVHSCRVMRQVRRGGFVIYFSSTFKKPHGLSALSITAGVLHSDESCKGLRCEQCCHVLPSMSGALRVRMQIVLPSRYAACTRELHIYRIVQEAMHNILKHSRASSANTVLDYCDHQLECTIKNNGVGYDDRNIFTYLY
jgi:hypothetical protein